MRRAIELRFFPLHEVVRIDSRAWPDASPVLQKLEATVPAAAHTSLIHARLSVEWLGPRGGHFLYGLLGASVEPSAGDSVRLDVMVGEGGPAERGTLADPLDRVHRGLPLEHARAVLDASVGFARRCGLPASRIHFDRAAHGEAGSSGLVFGTLAETLLALLSADLESEALRETVRARLLAGRSP